MKVAGEEGQTIVEYAIIAAVAASVFIVLVRLSNPRLFMGWLEGIRDVFFAP